MKDSERTRMADLCADLAVGLSMAQHLVDTDGRTLIDRMRLCLAGQPQAQAFDGVGGPSLPAPRLPIVLGRDGHPVPDRAAVDMARYDAYLSAELAAARAREAIAVRYLARAASRIEQSATDADELSRDAGCESCHRIVRPGGGATYAPTLRTGDGRNQGDKDGTTARLAKMLRLCRGCYDHVRVAVPPGAQMQMHEALPLRVVRVIASGRTPRRAPADPKKSK